LLPKTILKIKNKDNEQLIKAIICCGLYPNVAKIVKTYDDRGNNLTTKYITKTESCLLHPSSVLINSEQTGYSRPFILFQEKLQTKEIYLRSCEVIPPWPLLFFAKKLK